jgi:hypothetical protein
LQDQGLDLESLEAELLRLDAEVKEGMESIHAQVGALGLV